MTVTDETTAPASGLIPDGVSGVFRTLGDFVLP